MAKLLGALKITGSVGGLSIYRMKGCNELVVRTKGGFTRERILRDSSLRNVRSMNSEWSGVTLMAGAIRRALVLLSPMRDYNYTGQLCAIAKRMQKSPDIGAYGQRPVLLSSHRELLNGFSLNVAYPFPAVVQPPVKGTIDRTTRSATIEFAEMQPKLSLASPDGVSFYRFVGVLGAVSDAVYDQQMAVYRPADGKEETSVSVASQWFHLDNRFDGLRLELLIAEREGALHPQRTLLLGVGIEFGTIGFKGLPTQTGKGGAAMVIGVG